MRCTICGKPAPAGALLCPPCRAALKRAGHLTVQDLPHYLAPVRRPAGKGHRASGARRPVPGARAPAVPTAPSAGRRVLIAAAALAALAGVGYLGRTHMEPDHAPATAGKLAGPAPSSPAAVAPTAPMTPSGASPAPAATAPTAPAPPPVATITEPARLVTPRGPPRTKQAALRAEAVVPDTALPVAESVAAVAEPPPVPVPRAAPPPPDRWQQMSDALARCDREGGFSGFICDQRVRLDSCEGYWGKVPQCPNPPENPR